MSRLYLEKVVAPRHWHPSQQLCSLFFCMHEFANSSKSSCCLCLHWRRPFRLHYRWFWTDTVHSQMVVNGWRLCVYRCVYISTIITTIRLYTNTRASSDGSWNERLEGLRWVLQASGPNSPALNNFTAFSTLEAFAQEVEGHKSFEMPIASEDFTEQAKFGIVLWPEREGVLGPALKHALTSPLKPKKPNLFVLPAPALNEKAGVQPAEASCNTTNPLNCDSLTLDLEKWSGGHHSRLVDSFACCIDLVDTFSIGLEHDDAYTLWL